MPAPLLRSLLLLLVAAQTLPTSQSTESISCATPLTFSQSRLPAILEVENICQTAAVAVCLEFDSAVYQIHLMSAKSIFTVASVHQDCWVFRAKSCQGQTLLEHTAQPGTHKLTIGCTKAATDANSVMLSSSSTPLDCSLTVTPKLSDAFDASADALPAERRPDLETQLFDDLNHPIQFVTIPALLRGVYEMSFKLSRHAVPTKHAFAMFEHMRDVIQHTTKCHPELIGSSLGVANSYLAIYGSVFARLHAQYDVAGIWVDKPPTMTPANLAAKEALIAYAVGIDLSEQLPGDALPGPEHGLLAGNGARILVRDETVRITEPRLPHRGMNASLGWETARMGNVNGEELCASQGAGQWRFFKASKSVLQNSSLDCCLHACFADVAPAFSTRSFHTTCCLSCNMATCQPDFTARELAVIRRAEIQRISEFQVERPRTVML